MNPYNDYHVIRSETERKFHPDVKMNGGGTPNKAARFAVLVFLVVVVACVAIGIISGNEKADDGYAAGLLFNSKELQRDGGTPVIKRPFTVYCMTNSGGWKFREDIACSELLGDKGLTNKVGRSRTCIFIWPDYDAAYKSGNYQWKNTQTGATGTAYFCPVYLTVIDRENNVRYDDVKLGNVPLATHSKYRSTYSSPLYSSSKNWFTVDLGRWVSTRWEE